MVVYGKCKLRNTVNQGHCQSGFYFSFSECLWIEYALKPHITLRPRIKPDKEPTTCHPILMYDLEKKLLREKPKNVLVTCHE